MAHQIIWQQPSFYYAFQTEYLCCIVTYQQLVNIASCSSFGLISKAVAFYWLTSSDFNFCASSSSLLWLAWLKDVGVIFNLLLRQCQAGDAFTWNNSNHKELDCSSTWAYPHLFDCNINISRTNNCRTVWNGFIRKIEGRRIISFWHLLTIIYAKEPLICLLEMIALDCHKERQFHFAFDSKSLKRCWYYPHSQISFCTFSFD